MSAANRTVDAAAFLTSLGKLLSTASLYGSDHPARIETRDEAWDKLRVLLDDEPPVFSFLDDTVLYGKVELRDLRSWELGNRLYDAGIQRVEFLPGVAREELDELATDVRRRVAGPHETRTAAEDPSHPHIRLGAVTVRAEPCVDEGEEDPDDEPPSLDEELDAIRWVYEQAAKGEALPTTEVRLAVESLSLAMDSLRRLGSSLIAIKSRDQYTAIHSMNVSILSMSLAERVQYRPHEVRAIGEAALVHDIGKTKTPADILNKPGALTYEERKIIEDHTTEGCRLLLDSMQDNRLAATVAYEHHMCTNGRGYPKPDFQRDPHPVSRLVQVCDVYDALRTRRPFRAPMESVEAIGFLQKRAGNLFDADLVQAFVEMVGDMEHRSPRVQPQVAESEAQARAKRQKQKKKAGTGLDELEARLEAIADSLLTPEPTATVDWLELL